MDKKNTVMIVNFKLLLLASYFNSLGFNFVICEVVVMALSQSILGFHLLTLIVFGFILILFL